MNNSNYGYPPSGYTSPYSSTPSNVGSHRPRFGYSGPELYPRPRSSASKPNPDSYSDSMTNNYGNSTYNSEYADSYNSYKDDSSSYYSANDNYYPDRSSGDSSMPSMRGDVGLLRESPMLYSNKSTSDNRSSALFSNAPSHILQSKYQYSNPLGLSSNGGFQKTFSSTFSLTNKFKKQSLSTRKFGKAKAGGMAAKQGFWKCSTCDIEFTSQIPYDMHMRGAKHAKKLKAQQVSSDVKLQGVVGDGGETTFFCAVCNVRANSSLQFQMHLEGSKHKNKLNPKEPAEGQSKKAIMDPAKNATTDSTNGKTNGSVTRSLPSDFEDPQPAKLMKFSCDICSLILNSDVQLQQHLSSKKHQNKVEGKPVKERKKKVKENQELNSDDMEKTESSEPEASGEAAQKVVGVKTLASSFVQGETLNSNASSE